MALLVQTWPYFTKAECNIKTHDNGSMEKKHQWIWNTYDHDAERSNRYNLAACLTFIKYDELKSDAKHIQ